jgi:hypothetical protein
MQVAERFKFVSVTKLRIDLTALYVLAAPSTPQEATEEAVGEVDLDDWLASADEGEDAVS